MKGRFIDLHVHTDYSDGIDSIETILEKAKANNVGVISLTEHYNISSYKVALSLAGEDIEIIPGIEIGADMSKYAGDRKHVCHILGYFVSKDICRLLDEYEMDRYNCVVKTLEILKHHDINITMQQVLDNAKNKKSVGRFDIARTMKRLGYVEKIQDAYGKYLDHGGLSYVKRDKLNPVDLIKKIREYGGVAVLAHPKSLRFEPEQEAQFIKELADAGLGGIEVYNSNNSKEKREALLKYCEEYDLVPTVGSDYHGGKRKPIIEVGKGINNNLNISDMTIIDRLKSKIS